MRYIYLDMIFGSIWKWCHGDKTCLWYDFKWVWWWLRSIWYLYQEVNMSGQEISKCIKKNLTFSLTFFLASYLASVLTFFLAFYLTFSLASGWGPAAVRVWQCPLLSVWSSRLRSGSELRCGTAPTAVWSSRLRSGSAHSGLRSWRGRRRRAGCTSDKI